MQRNDHTSPGDLSFLQDFNDTWVCSTIFY